MMTPLLLLLAAVGAAAANPPPSVQQDPPIQLDDAPAAARSDLTCGSHTLTEGSYTISSPNHPSNYDNNYDCTYDLTAEAGVSSFYIECSAFDVELQYTCAYDWLKIDSVKFCGSSGPAVSQAGPMTIEFHTDYSIVRAGFQCTIKALSDANTANELFCGNHTVTPGLYSISSPGYPAKYDNYQDCSYSITPGSGVSSMTLACCEFDIENHSSCSWDWLSVNGEKFCGRQGPALSGDGVLNIDFHSDYSVVKRGFMCEVQALGN